MFEVKVKYLSIDSETGKQKTIKEAYLIDALSFTEAEARTIAKMESVVPMGLDVVSIAKSGYDELFLQSESDDSIYYKANVTYLNDEDSSKTTNKVLIMAENISKAYDKLQEKLSDSTMGFSINGVIDSKLSGVFLHVETEE